MSGGERVLIPEKARKIIQSIREITGRQHSDEDIYSVLRECSMDPNETTQKLLYLDTFHEVKHKRDKKKETPAPQGRGSRGRRGNISSKYANSAAGGSNAAFRRENEVHVKEGGSSLQKLSSHSISPVAKTSAVTSSGPSSLPNGNYSDARDVSLLRRDVKVTKDGSAVDGKKLDDASSEEKSTISRALTASDPVLAPSKQPGALNEIECVEQNAAGQNQILGSYETGIELPNDENETSGLNNVDGEKPEKASVTEEIVKKDLSEPLKPAPSLSNEGSPTSGSSNYQSAETSPEDAETIQNIKSLSETTVPDGHVIFPDHFKVSEALKIGLTFGSFGADNSTESSNETGETARESSSSNENESLTVQVDQPVQSDYPQHQPDKVLESVGSVASNADEKGDQWSAVIDQSKQEVSLSAEDNQNRMVHFVPNYGYGIMPTVQGVLPVQYEGHDTQSPDTHPSSFASENSMASSSPSPSPTSTPPVQNNVAAPPQLFFRPPYPPNYLPYGYFNPYFLAPMHQFMSHNGLPQQPSTGNAYAAAGAGVKYPLAHFKPGATGGNFNPVGYATLYGSYGSSPVGFNPGLAVTSGPSSGNEGLVASQLKESQIYTTGPMTEGSAWTTPSGQDTSGLPPNSFYHLPSQGHHLTGNPTQSGHGPYPGIYPIMTASSAANPFIQQSQAGSAATENAAPPSSAYQQPQHGHRNRHSSY